MVVTGFSQADGLVNPANISPDDMAEATPQVRVSWMADGHPVPLTTSVAFEALKVTKKANPDADKPVDAADDSPLTSAEIRYLRSGDRSQLPTDHAWARASAPNPEAQGYNDPSKTVESQDGAKALTGDDFDPSKPGAVNETKPAAGNNDPSPGPKSGRFRGATAQTAPGSAPVPGLEGQVEPL